MYGIGVDVGSTYTKYCFFNNKRIEALLIEKTPVNQRQYFKGKIEEIKQKYVDVVIVSCGYGRKNIEGIRYINELSALAQGFYFITKKDGYVLDVGGQDTKLILQENGRLKRFFINDKCAAGSGMFLINTLNMLAMDYSNIDLTEVCENHLSLSSSCAVFAQSEIVELIAANKKAGDILSAVICQIFNQAKHLLTKMNVATLYLSGGLSQIQGIEKCVERLIGIPTVAVENGQYLSAIGCAIAGYRSVKT